MKGYILLNLRLFGIQKLSDSFILYLKFETKIRAGSFCVRKFMGILDYVLLINIQLYNTILTLRKKIFLAPVIYRILIALRPIIHILYFIQKVIE